MSRLGQFCSGYWKKVKRDLIATPVLFGTIILLYLSLIFFIDHVFITEAKISSFTIGAFSLVLFFMFIVPGYILFKTCNITFNSTQANLTGYMIASYCISAITGFLLAVSGLGFGIIQSVTLAVLIPLSLGYLVRKRLTKNPLAQPNSERHFTETIIVGGTFFVSLLVSIVLLLQTNYVFSGSEQYAYVDLSRLIYQTNSLNNQIEIFGYKTYNLTYYIFYNTFLATGFSVAGVLDPSMQIAFVALMRGPVNLMLIGSLLIILRELAARAGLDRRLAMLTALFGSALFFYSNSIIQRVTEPEPELVSISLMLFIIYFFMRYRNSVSYLSYTSLLMLLFILLGTHAIPAVAAILFIASTVVLDLTLEFFKSRATVVLKERLRHSGKTFATLTSWIILAIIIEQSTMLLFVGSPDLLGNFFGSLSRTGNAQSYIIDYFVVTSSEPALADPDNISKLRHSAQYLFTSGEMVIIPYVMFTAGLSALILFRNENTKRITIEVILFMFLALLIGAVGTLLGSGLVPPWLALVRTSIFVWLGISFFGGVGIAFLASFLVNSLREIPRLNTRNTVLKFASGATLSLIAVGLIIPVATDKVSTIEKQGYITPLRLDNKGVEALYWIKHNISDDVRILTPEVTLRTVALFSGRTSITDGIALYEDRKLMNYATPVVLASKRFYLPFHDPEIITAQNITHVLNTENPRKSELGGIPLVKGIFNRAYLDSFKYPIPPNNLKQFNNEKFLLDNLPYLTKVYDQTKISIYKVIKEKIPRTLSLYFNGELPFKIDFHDEDLIYIYNVEPNLSLIDTATNKMYFPYLHKDILPNKYVFVIDRSVLDKVKGELALVKSKDIVLYASKASTKYVVSNSKDMELYVDKNGKLAIDLSGNLGRKVKTFVTVYPSIRDNVQPITFESDIDNLTVNARVLESKGIGVAAFAQKGGSKLNATVQLSDGSSVITSSFQNKRLDKTISLEWTISGINSSAKKYELAGKIADKGISPKSITLRWDDNISIKFKDIGLNLEASIKGESEKTSHFLIINLNKDSSKISSIIISHSFKANLDNPPKMIIRFISA